MALGFKFFTSSDPGAPALNPLNGSLTNVLDWALDTSDATNGWEIAFTATNKRVYRSRYGIRDYFRIDDSAGSGAALVRAYEAMSDVDTGTDPYPLVAQVPLANGKFSKTFTTSGSVAWDYYGIKTARFLMLIKPTRRSPETPAGAADIFVMGEIPALAGSGSDSHRSIISLHPNAGSPSVSDSPFGSNAGGGSIIPALGAIGQSSPTTPSLVMRRNRAGTVKSMPCRINVLNNGNGATLSSAVNDEPLTLVPICVSSGETANNQTMRNLRGYLPGLYTSYLDLDAVWTKGDTFTGADGKPYIYLRSTGSAATNGAILILGTTDEHGAL